MSRTDSLVLIGCTALTCALLWLHVYVPGPLCGRDGPHPLWCVFIHTVLTLTAGIAPGYIAGRFLGRHGLAVGFAVGFVGYVIFAIPDFVRVWGQWGWPVYAQFLWSGAENPGVLATLSGGLGEAHNRARQRYAL